jgi:hypothetical protein
MQRLLHAVWWAWLAVAAALALTSYLAIQAADQYLLDGLKRLCEKSIGDSVTIDNLMEVYELSEAFSAPELGKICVMFALDHYDEVVANWEPVQYADAMQRTVPLLKASLTEDLCRSIELVEERAMEPEEEPEQL